jgi:hypothetical protein
MEISNMLIFTDEIEAQREGLIPLYEDVVDSDFWREVIERDINRIMLNKQRRAIPTRSGMHINLYVDNYAAYCHQADYRRYNR